MPQNSQVLQQIIQHLTAQYQAHTIILYGSQADGSATAASDYDVAAYAPVATEIHDNAERHGVHWDVFIYPEAALATPAAADLKLRQGHILLQRGTQAQDFLAGLEAIYQVGPPALPPEDALVRQQWAEKMLGRIGRGDVEGHYRRAWLLMSLLEDYFAIRGRWYQGPKKSFAWLAANTAEDFTAFERALRPEAGLDDIRRLTARVFADVLV